MGQKVNPIGIRLGITRGWDSIWFAKKRDYGRLLVEDYKIRDYVKKNIVNSGVSHVVIERTAKKCIVSIYTSRPGFVIGKKGSDVDKIKALTEIFEATLAQNFELIIKMIEYIIDKESGEKITDANQIVEIADNLTKRSYDKLFDSAAKMNEAGIDTSMNVSCTDCSNEFESAVNLDPTSFFA